MATVGILHPGEMGAAVGAVARGTGHVVYWASAGRSGDTGDRARAAGLEDAGSAQEVARRSDVILSICPPHAAADVAASVARFAGIYVDANAIAPASSRRIGAGMQRYVDGGIIGSPPRRPGTRLYLSGPDAPTVAKLFAGTALDARVLSESAGDASALKMAYAAWTKGTAALLLAIRDVARAQGVEAALDEEWALSLPDLPARLDVAASSATAKGWRWVAEMEEIAATFAASGCPDGFHLGAAEMFRRAPRPK